MEGIRFVREEYLSIAGGSYLPYADLLGHVQARLHEVVFDHPELKPYIPQLLDVDIFISWDEDKFILLISKEKRAHLPTRGMEFDHLPSLRKSGKDLLKNVNEAEDISELPDTIKSFSQLQFSFGFAATGIFPAGIYTDEAKATKEATGKKIAILIQNWAQKRRHLMENSRIFLSHKGANKPLITRIDRALQMLNLKTWFDSDDLAAGDTLVRSVDNAFEGCSAAVFFISGDFLDSGVIRNEINRAIHEQSMRSDGFRVIPLVLAQHGGSDDRVPAPLKTLVWKTVDDIDIIPTILRALPQSTQATIKYSAQK